ncbi:MAG: hypothetical protein UT37_C0016G0003 [Parcubacteria group bacterium GW2011_GWA2_39_18]|nr:MAG: hypothetical protein UT37_C0016G0003 [Parcubacteria group bacterium GW2011_GWA2_39_18]
MILSQKTTEILIFVILTLDVLMLVLSVWLYIKYKKLFRGKKASDLERLVMSYIQDISLAGNEIEKIKNHLSDLQKQADGALQKFSVKRFNPFEEVGGDQSFSFALLNEENSGFVVTSLHTREGTRIYAKSIQKGKPENQLMDEEKEVLKEAIDKN